MIFQFLLELHKTHAFPLKLLLYLNIPIFSYPFPIKSLFLQIILNKHRQGPIKKSISNHLSSFSILLIVLNIVLVEWLIFTQTNQSFVFIFLFRFYLRHINVSFLQPPVLSLQFYMLL